MGERVYALLFWLALNALVLGCSPQIGDSCAISTDCSSQGDRLCDTTQPSGYCTIFNCEPGDCPNEAICVAFDSNISRAPECADPQGTSRLQRTFCLKKCRKDTGCRMGYECADMLDPDNPWAAVVVEDDPKRGGVCVPPFNGAALPADGLVDVCGETDAGFELDAFVPTGPDASTDSGDAEASDATSEMTVSVDASGDAMMSIDASDGSMMGGDAADAMMSVDAPADVSDAAEGG